MAIRIAPEVATRAVREYNAGVYRGRTNLAIDRAAYERFRDGMPTDRHALIDAVRFVGEDYGGAQRRFLPHGYTEEATIIAGFLLPVIEEWKQLVAATHPLVEAAPTEATLATLLEPFHGTKHWPVWASKTLHFLRPSSFPILDSRAKVALGVRNLGSTPRDYARFCSVFRDVLAENQAAITAARGVDDGASPSDVKLLDKIVYQLGGL